MLLMAERGRGDSLQRKLNERGGKIEGANALQNSWLVPILVWNLQTLDI